MSIFSRPVNKPHKVQLTINALDDIAAKTAGLALERISKHFSPDDLVKLATEVDNPIVRMKIKSQLTLKSI